MDKKQWEINLTRGIAYRHGLKWRDDNAKNMKVLLKDFKVKKLFFEKIFNSFFLKAKDVRIIIANFNQTIAIHMFCQVSYV